MPSPPNMTDDPFDDPLLLELQETDRTRWAVSWSDLMMTMFILFAVLYIYQSGHREFELTPGDTRSEIVEQGEASGEAHRVEPLPSQVFEETRQAFEEEFVSNFTNVDFVKDKAIRISIASDLLFDLGKADLKPRARERLRQVADILKKSNLAINIAGHTDITPIHSVLYPTNWELSAIRACRVARFMIESCGVSPDRFTLTAHSFYQPVTTSDTRDNRALNRRVEIILMKKKNYTTEEGP